MWREVPVRRDRPLLNAAIGLGLGGAIIVAASGHHGGGAGAAGQAAAVPVPGAVRLVTPGPGEAGFFRAVLADLGYPATAANVDSLMAWSRHEFRAWPPAAAFNPLASTHWVPGSAAFNTFGSPPLHVWNYPAAPAGAAAEAATLANGRYPHLLARLAAGRGVCGPGLTSDFHTWNGGTYGQVC
jgi:hypothetical protein